MAVFILAVIVNSYTTGQVCVCIWMCVFSQHCLFAHKKPKGRMYQIIHLLPSPGPQWVLSGPHVTLRYDCIAHCVFLVDIGYVTFLSPAVPSIISISVSVTSVVTLYHHKCHFVLLLASGVQSQKPFVPDADQMSKGVMLG